MLNQNPADMRQVLAGKANCAACGGLMVRLGPDFTCPTRVIPNAHSCLDNTINADRLLRLVATQVVSAVMTDQVVEKVTGLIQEDAQNTSERLQNHLDQAELLLSDLNRQHVELHAKYASPEDLELPSNDEVQDNANRKAAISFEARNSRREIDAQAFISDDERVRANATEAETYLDQTSPETTRQFMDIFVKALGVGPSSIEVTYSFPIPSDEFPEGRTTDVIPRSESDQTGVVSTGGPQDSPATPQPPR